MPASLLTVTPLTASGISHVFDNIPYSPIIWFDASKIAGISSGASLSAWTDVSGNGNHAIQSSAGSQPTYQTNAQNGLPAVRFTTANKSFLFASAYSVAQPVTYFAAYKATNKAAIYTVTGGPISQEATIFNDAAGFPGIFGTAIIAYPLDSSGTWTIVGGIFSGSSSTLWLKGISTTSFGNAGSVSHKSFFIGQNENANYFLGDIAEIVGYNRALTASEASTVFSYLGSKWGIAVS